MNKSKIEWCDYTWNPVSGCYYMCDYCYARRIAERFKGNKESEICSISSDYSQTSYKTYLNCTNKVHILDVPQKNFLSDRTMPYPYGFEPTFYRYKLQEPTVIKKSSKIFICSMGDLLGNWIPISWIKDILRTVELCPNHTFMMLTKNPTRYNDVSLISKISNLKNLWIGTTITSEKDSVRHIKVPLTPRNFLSIEPLKGPIYITYMNSFKWIIIGGQTGPGAIIPRKEWVENIINQARSFNIPVFLKDNLKWDEKIQEYPRFK